MEKTISPIDKISTPEKSPNLTLQELAVKYKEFKITPKDTLDKEDLEEI